MRTGLIGLSALYYPISQGDRLVNKKGVEFVSAATLGDDSTRIKSCMGLTPEEYGKKYSVKIYEDAEVMIEKENLEALVICSRNSEHAYWTEKAAKLGVKKIYMPKAFAVSIEDAERMVEIKREYGMQIACGPSMRYLPHMVALRLAIENEVAGKPHYIRLCHHHGTIKSFNEADWYRDAREGGPEMSLGWYGVDLATFLMGAKVEAVSANYSNFMSPDSPFMDCGRMEMLMEGGKVAQFDMYFCLGYPYPGWQIEIICEKGVLSLHRVQGDACNTVAAFQNSDGYRLLPLPENTVDMEAVWMDDFLCGREPVVNEEYSKYITAVCLKARDSANKREHSGV